MGILLTILFVMSLVWLPVEKAAPGPSTLVSLGEVSSTPRSEVMVPFFLTLSSPELQVCSVSATIRFDAKTLQFRRAEKGFFLDGVNAGFEVHLQEDPKDPNKGVLQLEVTTKGEPRKALKEGSLVTLVFEIADGAPAKTKTSITLEKVSAMDLSTPPKAIAPLTTKNGTAEVISTDAAGPAEAI